MKTVGKTLMVLFGMALLAGMSHANGDGTEATGAEVINLVQELESRQAAQADQIANQLQEFQNRFQAMQAMQQQFQQMQAENEQLRNRLNQMEARDFEGIQRKSTQMEQRIQQLEGRNSELANRNASLEQTLQKLEAELGSACANMQQISPRIDDMMDAQTNLVGQLDEVRSELRRTTDCVSISGDIRWRGVTFNNLWTFDDDNKVDARTWNRFRTRVAFTAEPMDNLRAFIMLTNEYRWGDENKITWHSPSKDIAIDQAYIEIMDILDQPLTLKVGRQNLMFGEGFVVFDGTPYHGSRTISFDAIRLTYRMEDPATTIDLFQAKTHEGDYLSPTDVNFRKDEDLHGLYVTGQWLDFMKFEPYIMHRRKKAVAMWQTQFDPKMRTIMPGLRVSGNATSDIDYAAELAYQFGKLEDYGPMGEDVDRKAWGGYVWGRYTLREAAWTPSLKLSFTYLSGDDPDTKKFEGWDSFYAEWPKWSELYVYSLYDPFPNVDPDLGTFTNMYIPGVEVSIKPTNKLQLVGIYNYFAAAEPKNGLRDSRERGHNPQVRAFYNFNKSLTGHLWGEYFIPGKYYGPYDDNSYFARAELMLKF